MDTSFLVRSYVFWGLLVGAALLLADVFLSIRKVGPIELRRRLNDEEISKLLHTGEMLKPGMFIPLAVHILAWPIYAAGWLGKIRSGHTVSLDMLREAELFVARRRAASKERPESHGDPPAT